jgi:hypothetical protein
MWARNKVISRSLNPAYKRIVAFLHRKRQQLGGKGDIPPLPISAKQVSPLALSGG